MSGGGYMPAYALDRSLDDLIAEFQMLQEKWKGLLEGVDRTDSEAIAKVLQDNLYAKIDENTFGMN